MFVSVRCVHVGSRWSLVPRLLFHIDIGEARLNCAAHATAGRPDAQSAKRARLPT